MNKEETIEVDLKRATVQNNALTAWELSNKKGVIEAITGIGKNFIFLKALHTCPKNIDVLFLAEQVDRKYDLLKDIDKFDKLHGTTTLIDYNITFMTYQSAYKLKDKYWDFVCADEIHDSLTPEYSKFYFNNRFKYFIGLSATIPNTKYIDSNGVEWTKRGLLNSIAPICFTYTLAKGQVEKTTRPLNIIVITNELNTTDKVFEVKTKKSSFLTTEREAYNYWEDIFNKYKYLDNPKSREFLLRMAASKRAEVIYKLPSKVRLTSSILKVLKGKTLVFGNDIEFLEKITPNVISSKNSEKKNNTLRTMFENEEINVLGAFKKLKQGANLPKLDNIIITSYYSSTKDLIQRVGRLRKDNERIGNVIILLTKGTREQDWFYKMFKDIDLNIKMIESSELNKLNSLLVYNDD